MDEEQTERRKLLYEMEDELWGLLKRRGWIVGLIGIGAIWALVGFTVRQVADGPLKDLQKQVVYAEVQADGAKRAGATASTAAEQVATNIAALQATIQGLGDQAKAIENQFELVSQQIDAASKNAALRSQKDFVAVQQRIAALEALVKRIGDENAATRKATAEYAKQVAALENKVDREQKRFAENSAYTVSIYVSADKRSLATELQRRLASAGFRAALVEIPLIGNKNSLSYYEKSESKAQEILALLKPLLREIDTTKLPSLPRGTLSPDFKTNKSVAGIAALYMTPFPFDPNNLALIIGG